MDLPGLEVLLWPAGAAIALLWRRTRRERARASVSQSAREQAEGELGRVQERLALAQQAGGIGTFDWLVAEGRLVLTAELQALLGLVGDAATGWTASVHPEDAADLERRYRRCLAEGHPEFIHEFRVLRPDGAVRWLAIRGRVHFDAAGAPSRLVGVAIDFTERRLADEAAQAAHRELADVLSCVGDGFYSVDREWRFAYVNPAAARHLGRPAEALLGCSLWEVAPEKLGTAFEDQFRRAMDGRCAVRFETVSPLSHRWVETNAWPRENGLSVSFRDVTARKRMEQALRESEGRFRAMADTAPVHIWLDDADEGCQFVNRAFLEFAGMTQGEAQGAGWTRLVHPDDVEGLLETFQQAADAQCVFHATARFRRHDGEFRWLQIDGVPRRTPSGEFVGFLGCNVDISEVKAAEAEAEAANRAKDEFIAALSHELRTPLTPLLVSAQMLGLDPALPADVREAAQLIRRNVELERRLIDDLLDLTRIRHGKMELQFAPTDVHEVLRHAIDACAAELRAKDLQLSVTMRAERSWVMGDPARLQQVIWNLLRNAGKFTPAGGRIVVGTAATHDGALLVEVEDSGMGIDPEMLPRLFNAFEQGGRQITKQFGGVGLGLAIGRGLVEAHRGTLTAHSDGWGRGARFVVRLPLLDDVAAVRSPPSLPPAAVRPEAAGTRVLIVDDDPDTVTLMSRCLVRYGYHVRAADSVGAALQAADDEEFDLVVSDIGLPDGSGLDLMRRLRETRRLRGIALSGYGMDEDVRRSHDAGFAAHLTKPVDLKRLLIEIERVAIDGETN